jgi:hypothetical protein
MKIEPWSFIYFRKLPANYHGLVVMEFDHGELKEISKVLDANTKEIFLSRYKEVRAQLSHGSQGELRNGN